MARKKANVTRIEFDGPATVRKADALHAKLSEALSQSDQIEIDTTATTEVDLSFVQLVLAARKSALAAGKRLTLSAPADGAMRDTLVLGGFLTTAEGSDPDMDFWLNRETAQ